MDTTTQESPAGVLKKWGTLQTELDHWRSLWETNSLYFAPQLDILKQNPRTPDATGFVGLYSAEGISVLDTYVNGIISELFPANEKWMLWVPQDDHETDDAARKWYGRCSELALTHVGRSNFYQTVKPTVTDMGLGGTGAFHVDRGKESLLRFGYCRLGTYAIQADSEGKIRTFFREKKWTPEQMVEAFGEEALGEKALKALEKQRNGEAVPELTVIHAVFPRTQRNAKSILPEDMPYASLYVCKEDANTLETKGYETFPYAVIRAEMWNDYDHGLAPATKSIPVMREINKMTRDLHEGATMMVRPPVLIPEDMVEEVAYYPNGQTIYDPGTSQHKPEQWGLKNEYALGKDLLASMVATLRGFFHAALFEAVAQKEKTMTAREVAAIEGSALRQFLPNFNQMVSELQPTFQQIFNVLFEAGVFPDPPESVRIPSRQEGYDEIPAPKVEFTSRLALALRLSENAAIDRTLERLVLFAPIMPEILENYNMDELVRIASRNDGIPENIIELKKAVDEKRKARLEDEQQAAQLEQLATAAKAGKDADGIKNPAELLSLAG